MKSRKKSQEKLVIFSCCGTSYQGRLVTEACRELESDGQADLTPIPWFSDIRNIRPRRSTVNRWCLVVDGCERVCMQKQLRSMHVFIEQHLVLTELGIDNAEEHEALCGDDLELAKDGIIAAGSGPADIVPKIPGCCCC